jgi:hypothetical protein
VGPESLLDGHAAEATSPLAASSAGLGGRRHVAEVEEGDLLIADHLLGWGTM